MTDATSHELFLSNLPRIKRTATYRFRHLDPDKREEAVQNTCTLAWKAFHRLSELGRENEPGILNAVTTYSIRQTKAGRMIQGTNQKKAKDVLTYRDWGRVKCQSDAISGLVSKSTPIPDAVSFRIDVPAFLETLNDRQRQIADDLVCGMTTSEVAEKHKVTAGAISQFRTRFKTLFDEFFAE